MDIVFYLLNLLSLIFTVVVFGLMLFTLRKERIIGRWAPLLSAFLPLLMLPLFMILSGARLNWFLSIPIFLLGLAVGVLRGFTTKLYFKDDQVVGKHSLLFLFGWCMTLLLAQLLNVFGSVLLSSVGLMPLFFGTGTQVALFGTIFVRRMMLRPPQPQFSK